MSPSLARICPVGSLNLPSWLAQFRCQRRSELFESAALDATLILLGANVLSDLNFHQLPSQHAHSVAQEVDLTSSSASQQLLKRHSQVLGHRLWSAFSEISSIPMETVQWSFVSTT